MGQQYCPPVADVWIQSGRFSHARERRVSDLTLMEPLESSVRAMRWSCDAMAETGWRVAFDEPYMVHGTWIEP